MRGFIVVRQRSTSSPYSTPRAPNSRVFFTMSTSSLMAEKTVHNVAYTDLRHKAKCRVLILARTNLSQHNFTTCSRLHNFTTSSQLQDFFTTLLISQLSSTTWILERICGLFWAERMSAKGKFTLSPLDVLQGFSFLLQMGFTLTLATLDGLDVGWLGDVIGEDDCDDDG
ncbi:hypothetical protein Tco_0678617 [Tanacetum coccineum]|uniref:Uncharacterized protein n=1 Tax=Tanacetum coccineum TaxID=301880 RepID=A0ABQ4XGH8_9ASTR